MQYSLSGDQSIILEISDDAMRADIKFQTDRKSTSRAILTDLVKQAGIIHGLDREGVLRCLDESNSESSVTIAEGTEPIPGADGWMEIIPKPPSSPATDLPKILGMASVTSNGLLAKIHAPGVGIPGTTVRGESIPAPAGHEGPALHGNGLRPDPDDPTLIRSEKSGAVEITPDGSIIIHESVVIERDINADDSPIRFGGSMTVKGDILAGVKMEIGGDLHVDGGVDDVEITVGGSVTLGKGFMGSGAGRLFVEKDAKVFRIVHQKLDCGGDLILENDATMAELIVGGELKGESAKLFGGSIHVRSSVDVRDIGDDDHPAAKLYVGSKLRLHAKFEEAQTSLDLFDRLIQTKKERLVTLAQRRVEVGGTLPDQDSAEFQSLRQDQPFWAERRQAIVDGMNTLEELIKEDEHPIIRVRGLLMDGVLVSINGEKMIIDRECRGMKLFEEDKELHTAPI